MEWWSRAVALGELVVAGQRRVVATSAVRRMAAQFPYQRRGALNCGPRCVSSDGYVTSGCLSHCVVSQGAARQATSSIMSVGPVGPTSCYWFVRRGPISSGFRSGVS